MNLTQIGSKLIYNAFDVSLKH